MQHQSLGQMNFIPAPPPLGQGQFTEQPYNNHTDTLKAAFTIFDNIGQCYPLDRHTIEEYGNTDMYFPDRNTIAEYRDTNE
jgi:hypothetical protein